MEMKLSALLMFTLLSVSIFSYGVGGSSVFADDHNIPPISASTNLPTYENGGKVIVSGNIKDYDSNLHSGQDIVFMIISPPPINNLVTIGQITPSSDGSFQVDFTAGGVLWKAAGDYIIEFRFAGNTGSTTIVYSGGETSVTPPPTCTSDQTLVDGVCIDNAPEDPTCGPGTELVNGMCQVIATDDSKDDEGGSCLIATAAYGTELAPQVQFLREIRDNTIMNTESGIAFMSGFNTLYYSFAPTIADMEREHPMFQEAVRVFITPMISTLSIMALADNGSEVEVLGLGISVIVLNLGMYIAAPALVGFKVHKHIKSRK